MVIHVIAILCPWNSLWKIKSYFQNSEQGFQCPCFSQILLYDGGKNENGIVVIRVNCSRGISFERAVFCLTESGILVTHGDSNGLNTDSWTDILEASFYHEITLCYRTSGRGDGSFHWAVKITDKIR